MTKDTMRITVSDGIQLAVHRWLPEGKPAAIMQISHGMGEYAMRYDRFAEAAVGSGCAVLAADHRGHGETAGALDRLGYLGDSDGFTRVMEDQHEITCRIRDELPDVPVVLLGHSFGSLIAQLYMERYGYLLDGCILSGTRGPTPVTARSGHLVSAMVGLLRGWKTPSPFLDGLLFGSYNRRIPDAESPNSWLTRDADEVAKYDASPWSGFVCSAGFYRDLTGGLTVIHSRKMLGSIPRDLPVFIFGGTEDPVGDYGKTPARLAALYARLGIGKLEVKLYPGARHELLNETNRDEATSDILSWTAKVTATARILPLTEDTNL